MATTISKLAEKVVDDLFTEYPTMFLNASRAAYTNALQQRLVEIIDTDVELSRVTPDYESVMLRLIQSLSGDAEWYDLITAKTGHAIIRSIASGIAYGQFSIERAYQEAFLQSSSSQTAAYSNIRSLGLRPQRRQPARVTVQLTRSTATNILTIPAYSVFSCGDMKFFNREAIIFNTNVFTVTKQLFQGVLQYESIASDGEPFQKYTVGDGEYNASDIDLTVTINGVVWTRYTDGIHLFGREETAYQENTALNGDVQLEFGNGEYGLVPPLSSMIEVMWVKTLGEEGNVDSSGIDVKWDEVPANITVTGTTLTNIENGAERILTETYKVIGPNLYAAQGRAVRRADYKVQALRFSGVYDALFRGQAEIAPKKRSMMNVIVYTLLTDENWTTANHTNFVDYMREHIGIYQCEFIRADPIAITMDVAAKIYCKPDADLQDIQDTLIDLVEKLYAPKVNTLGRSIYLSAVSDVLNGRDVNFPSEKLEKQVEYVILDPSMTDKVISNKKQYVKLGNLSLSMYYTTRSGFTGRLDIAPSQA